MRRHRAWIFLRKFEMLHVLVFLFLLYQSLLSKCPWGFKFTLAHSATSKCNVFGSWKNIPRNFFFFFKRTDLTFYLELFKLPLISSKLKWTCKYGDNWLEPLRYQYHHNSFPRSFYLFSCQMLAGPMHLSLREPSFCIVPPSCIVANSK